MLAIPSLASAQAQDMAAHQRPMYELPALTVVVTGESPLDQRAADLYQKGEWTAAADLYVDAADKMPAMEAASYRLLDMAGRLYFYGRDYGKARRAMERAAKVAEATGDIVAAALRHVDAAFIAVWEGYPASRREHIQKAHEHAQTEGFGEENAGKIEALIYGVESLPVSEGEN
jgi:hypothetical protein